MFKRLKAAWKQAEREVQQEQVFEQIAATMLVRQAVRAEQERLEKLKIQREVRAEIAQDWEEFSAKYDAMQERKAAIKQRILAQVH